MICPSLRIAVLVIAGLAFAAAPAGAQLMLPGAGPAAPTGAAAAAPKPKPAGGGAKAKTAKTAKTGKAGKPAKSATDAASVDGRPLMLNGTAGVLQVSGAGDKLNIDKLSLAGESVSDPSQRCVVNIVGETPIVANGAGRPDGLERYEVDVPACPFAFDVANGAVIVPAQITACVFKAADCQTSPGGVWGPDAGSLAADADAIGKRRGDAEKAMSRALRAIEDRAKDDPDAASLVRDQAAFPGARDEMCRGYARETEHGFCGATVTEARAALLEARLAAMSPSGAKGDKSAKSEKPKHKKAKPADAAANPGATANPTAANPQ